MAGEKPYGRETGILPFFTDASLPPVIIIVEARNGVQKNKNTRMDPVNMIVNAIMRFFRIIPYII